MICGCEKRGDSYFFHLNESTEPTRQAVRDFLATAACHITYPKPYYRVYQVPKKYVHGDSILQHFPQSVAQEHIMFFQALAENQPSLLRGCPATNLIEYFTTQFYPPFLSAQLNHWWDEAIIRYCPATEQHKKETNFLLISCSWAENAEVLRKGIAVWQKEWGQLVANRQPLKVVIGKSFTDMQSQIELMRLREKLVIPSTLTI